MMAEICDIFFESVNQCSMYSVCTYSVYCCIFKGDGFPDLVLLVHGYVKSVVLGVILVLLGHLL